MSRDKRLNRTQEVVGSIPISSTRNLSVVTLRRFLFLNTSRGTERPDRRQFL